MNTSIERVVGRRVWDSRGRPTVEAEVHVTGGVVGRAIAPAGASTGSREAVDLRDGDDAFGGFDVTSAVASVNSDIDGALRGSDVGDQAGIDRILVELDGTDNKAKLGANATVAVSMATAHAGAAAAELPLWRYLAGDDDPLLLPLPEVQIFGGGAHAGRRVDIQDFMIIAVGATSYIEALDWTAEVYRAAGKLMDDAGLLQGVADEGGYWPAFTNNEEALSFLCRAIEQAGYRPGLDVAISLDIAASDFGTNGLYRLARDGREIDSSELIETLLSWLRSYPIVSIEDPVAEDDMAAMAAFTDAAGSAVQVVADDFICTNRQLIQEAAAHGACNTALIKPNQIGTLTEARQALAAARDVDWGAIVSARSGETEDVTICHLAVGWGVRQLKVGSFARGERMAKWNECIRIADALHAAGAPIAGGALSPRTAFPWA